MGVDLQIEIDDQGTVTLSKELLCEHFGATALGGVLRACVHVNRVNAVVRMGHSEAVKSAPDWLGRRERSALTVIAMTSMEDAELAVHDMRHHGFRSKLSWSMEIWDELVALAARWHDKNGAARTLRNRIVHPEGVRLVRALEDGSDERFILLRTAAEIAPERSYEGADALAIHGWTLDHAAGTDPTRTADVRSLTADMYAFGDWFEAVLLDALGWPEPPAAEILQTLSARDGYLRALDGEDEEEE